MIENIYEKDIRDTITDDIERNKYVLSRIIYFIDKICNKYGINYSISYGTLVGAVRDKNLITWDLDGDVVMDQDSYLLFLEKAQAELPKYLFLQNSKTDPLFCSKSTFSRIVDFRSEVNPTSSRRICPNGIHCDIHCIMTDKEKYERIVKQDNLFFFIKKIITNAFICLGYLLTSLDFKRSIIQYLGYSLYLSFETVFITGKKYIDEVYLNYNLMDNEYIELRDLHVKAPKQADGFLRRIYGDYMIVPKDEKILQQYKRINSNTKLNRNPVFRLIYEKKVNK